LGNIYFWKKNPNNFGDAKYLSLQLLITPNDIIIKLQTISAFCFYFSSFNFFYSGVKALG